MGMSADKVFLPAKVREYFAAIGRRGGEAGRRLLTRPQARLMVAIREAKRHARKTGKAPPKLTRKQMEILGQTSRRRRN